MKWGRAVWMALLTIVLMALTPVVVGSLSSRPGPALEFILSLAIAGVVLPLIFAWCYFKITDVVPTLTHGIYLGLLIFLIPLILILVGWTLFPIALGAPPIIGVAFVVGIITGGDSVLQMTILIAAAPYFLGLLVAALTGFSMGRKRGRN
ncbi:MAG TPA: hypothetical protein VMH91_01570 [Candidatus Paceibacterota bacterium]|nr:hypothetical protein [Candidatus Paceibacterota bacterium]